MISTSMAGYETRPSLAAFARPLTALAAEDTQFDLRHIEPTAMFGSVVELQPLQDSSAFAIQTKPILELHPRFIKTSWTDYTSVDSVENANPIHRPYPNVDR